MKLLLPKYDTLLSNIRLLRDQLIKSSRTCAGKQRNYEPVKPLAPVNPANPVGPTEPTGPANPAVPVSPGAP